MDADSYRQVVLANKDRVFGFAARLLGDREEARDIAQEALVRLWEHRGEVNEEPAARAWLLRTAHNLCFDRLRARSVRRESDPELLDDMPSDREPSPESRTVNRELGAAIASALAGLAPRDRAVLLMREVHGMSYDDVAETLGVPLGTLKAVLHRARERARARLVAAGVRP